MSDPTAPGREAEEAGGSRLTPEEALERAREAAGDRTVSIAGGAATVNQYLRAGLIDELRLHIAPVVLGAGEAPLADLAGLELEQIATRSTKLVTHITYRVVR